MAEENTSKVEKKKKRSDRKRSSSTKKKVKRVRSHASEYASVQDVQNKDPNYHYRWVNKAGEQVESRKADGYEVVQGSMKEKAVMSGAGTVRQHAHAVLMRIPNAMAVEIHRRSVERSNRFTKTLTNKKGQREHYEEQLRKSGIKDRLIKID